MPGAPTRLIAKKKWTRRDLLKLAQVGGVGAVGAGLAFGGRADAEVETRRGVCRLCTMHCGIVATLKGGKLARIDGDLKSNTSGFVCLNGQGYRELLASRARIHTPLVRKGDHFEPVDWESAIALVAERLLAIRAKKGPASIAFETGWPFVRHPLVPYIQRLCDALGTPNLATVASLCEASGRMGRALVHGSNYWPMMQKAKTLVIWGANPAHAAGPYFHQVVAAAKSPRALIVIDPVRTEVAAHATHHLMPRPGTDGALALGILRILIEEDRVKIPVPPADLADLGRLAAAYTPAEVERLTTVPAQQLETVARILSENGPTAIWDGLGVEHHENGVQTVRAISVIYSLCGGLEATAEARPGEIDWHTPEPMPPRPSIPAIGAVEFPVFHAFQRQAQKQRFPAAIEAGELSALVLVGSNALLTAPGSARLRAAVDKLDLLVVVDPFLTASAEHADVVLPATTFGEDAPLSLPGGEGAWPDDKLIFSLARALGFAASFPWQTLAEAEQARRGPHKSKGTPLDPSTLTIRSAVLEEAGQPGLPVWTPPSDAPSPEFPLILVAGPRTRAFINSQLREAPSVRAKMPRPLARLNPAAAAARGIADGDPVIVRTKVGSVQFWAELSGDIHPEVVVVPHGWAEANANLLTDLSGLDPISGFPAFRSRACQIARS